MHKLGETVSRLSVWIRTQIRAADAPFTHLRLVSKDIVALEKSAMMFQLSFHHNSSNTMLIALKIYRQLNVWRIHRDRELHGGMIASEPGLSGASSSFKVVAYGNDIGDSLASPRHCSIAERAALMTRGAVICWCTGGR